MVVLMVVVVAAAAAAAAVVMVVALALTSHDERASVIYSKDRVGCQRRLDGAVKPPGLARAPIFISTWPVRHKCFPRGLSATNASATLYKFPRPTTTQLRASSQTPISTSSQLNRKGAVNVRGPMGH